MTGGTVARVVVRDVLSVTGPDARSYLQGQCSQDLDDLGVGASTEALLLSPQGKIDAYVRISRTGDETFVLDADPGCGSAAVDRLQRFRLRTRADIETLDWSCLSLRGPGTADLDRREGATLALAVDWPQWTGVDLLGPHPADDPELGRWLPGDVAMCDEEVWEAARIEAGVPVGGREVTESTIAAEVGLVERTVSFTKGCFTGQELVARLDARGSKVARRLRGIVVGGGERPPVGSTVWTADAEHQVGTVTSAAWSERRGAQVALATLHRRVEPPEEVMVRWAGGDVAAVARQLPLLPA